MNKIVCPSCKSNNVSWEEDIKMNACNDCGYEGFDFEVSGNIETPSKTETIEEQDVYQWLEEQRADYRNMDW